MKALRAVEETVSTLESMLSRGEFALVDAVLHTINVEETDPATLIGAVSITFHGKDRLLDRTAFVERVEESLRRRLGPERTTKLLEHRR